MSLFSRSLLILALLALGLGLGLLFGLDRLSSPIQAQQSTTVSFNTELASKVTTRDGEQWNFTGCISDVVTIVMTSTAFSPYLELTGPTSTQSLATGEANGDTAAIADHPLTASGVYTVWTGGDSRSARGDYRVIIHLAESDTLADVAGMASYGVPVTGSVTTRDGQSWGLRVCAGDIITITMESEAFDPYLELADPATEESLAEDDNSGAAQTALIASYPITRSGLYRLTALGAKRSDRGAYTLLITAQNHPALALPAAAPAATATATRRASATATPIPTPMPALLCTVQVEGLNLRSGPGTIYPPIGNLALGTQVRPLARDRVSTWIEIQASGNKTGWVSASAQYITCGVNIATLPIGVIPPPPTATPLPTPTPTQQIAQAPTPTPPSYFGLPGGGGGGGFDGDVLTERGFVADRNNPVFRDRFHLRMEVYNTPNNRRIDRVDFFVRLQTDDGDVVVYEHTERTAGYCLFGGGEPNCNVLFLQPGVTWPGTDRRILDGFYNVDIDVYVEGRDEPGEWNTFFEIDIPGQDAGDNQGGGGGNGGGNGSSTQDLVVNLAQTGPGTTDSVIFGEIVFQVEAFDPNVGTNDGDGIANVDLWIIGPEGEIYQRTENSAHYCAFAGGEPDCNVQSVAELGLTPGVTYTLRARANAHDGRQKVQEWQVTVQ